MSMDMEEQYDKIYRYCYFRLHSQQKAEDITQETFLRYLEKYPYTTTEQTLKCLYTIARNLCIDEYRKHSKELLCEMSSTLNEERLMQVNADERILTNLAVRAAVASLEQDEQELLLLRYVNEVPLLTIGQLLGISRFAVYRRLNTVTRKLKEALRKEGFQ